MDINEKRRLRFLFMKNLYEFSNGDSRYVYEMKDIAKNIGISIDQANQIGEYLNKEGLIRMTMDRSFSITHLGVVETEQALTTPEKNTEHFPPVNIINIQTMTNSAIQQGTSDSNQNLSNAINDTSSILAIITKIDEVKEKLNLNSNDRLDLECQVDTIKSQLRSSNPKKSIIKETFGTIKEIMSKVAVDSSALMIMEMINNWVSQI